VIMLLFAILIPGRRPYTHWQFTARGSTVHVGLLLGDIVHFLIMAAVLFLFLVKFLGWVMRTKTEEIAAMPPMTKDQELLAEIRDLLKDRPPARPMPQGE
jgi:large conductance mechanosensitive channel